MGIPALRVSKKDGERVRGILYQQGLLDRSYQIADLGTHLEIPIRRVLPESILKELEEYSIELIEMTDPVRREIPPEPFEMIEKSCELEESQKRHLPRKWELIGDVLVLKFPDELKGERPKLAELYANVLGAKAVLEDLAGITGIDRKPEMEIIYGTKTETVHVENGIKYKLDTMQLMFSSGNISERLRMAELNCKNEVIADMFAGIGYFTLPLAVYTKPAHIYACDINPVAFNYLKANITNNGVEGIVEPLLGDCRTTVPEGIADRIVMGNIKPDETFLQKGLKILKPEGGIIHYHQVCPTENYPDEPKNRLEDAAGAYNFKVKVLEQIKIKSYAPGISHIVLDARIYT
ncbi:MAG: class I SAM-dependent methyltransferase family protein [Thermoplasmata archaeon]|nr:MAG: class I SAM-dependent methyltransferase family protein [Thermoplasmata archaeon]